LYNRATGVSKVGKVTKNIRVSKINRQWIPCI